jgi:hypothetical protein
MTAEVFGMLVAIKPTSQCKMSGRGSWTKNTYKGTDADDND